MNFKEKLQTVLQKLKLWDKAKANQLTQQEWGQIVNSYQQEYQVHSRKIWQPTRHSNWPTP